MAHSHASSEFTNSPLVGTSSVYYTNFQEVRFEEALATAEAFRDANLPYVVVDASPQDNGNWVTKAHEERGAVVISAEIPGIATQRKQGVAFAIANGAEKIVGLEPEKPTVPRFASEISHALDVHDVLVIGRTPGAEATLPPVQRRAERLAGWILTHTHSLPNDALAGPRGFSKAGAEVLADYQATELGMNNWLYLYETPMEARRRGLSIGGTTVDMMYSNKIVAEETGNSTFDAKRYMQFTMQLNHLLSDNGLDSSFSTAQGQSIAHDTNLLLPMLESAPLEEKPNVLGRIEGIMVEKYGYMPG